MFSDQSRCIYQKPQLAEVICQLRFPQILSIGTNVPVDFQEAIRDTFPQYTVRNEGLPNSAQGQILNYQFTSADGQWRINLTNHFISLTCSAYTCWETFAGKLDKPLAAFISHYKPAYFERVGLRYMNFISRKALGLEDIPYQQLIQSCYLGILQEEDVQDSAVTRSTTDAELSLRGGCRAKIHAGPGLVKINGVQSPEPRFILDLDLFMNGNIPVNHSAGALQTLHSHSYPIFRGAITDLLHDAMEPQ